VQLIPLVLLLVNEIIVSQDDGDLLFCVTSYMSRLIICNYSTHLSITVQLMRRLKCNSLLKLPIKLLFIRVYRN